MDTLLLEFELNEAEQRRFWARSAEADSRVRRWMAGAVAAIAAIFAPILFIIGEAGWAFAAVMTAVVVGGMQIVFPYNRERALKRAMRGWGHRIALGYAQSLEVTQDGVRATSGGLVKANLHWADVDEAIRELDYLYVRSGSREFIIPYRAFTTADSRDGFNDLVNHRIPATAWRAAAISSN